MTLKESPALGSVERAADRSWVPLWLASGRYALDRIVWFGLRVWRVTWWMLASAPYWTLRAVKPFFRGAGRCIYLAAAWVMCLDWKQSIDKMDEGAAKAGAKRRAMDRTRVRLYSALGATGAATLGVLYLTGRYGSVVPVGLVLAAVALFEVVGYTADEPILDDLPEAGPLRHGVPLRVLRASIVDVLAEWKVPAQVTDLHAVEHGFEMVLHTAGKAITGDIIDALERGIHAPPGTISTVPCPDDAAAQVLRINLTDPLGDAGEPPGVPLTITKPLPVGVGRGAARFLLNLLRTHLALVGMTRSGKSSALWTLIDRFDLCADVEVVGVDLSNGPALAACRGMLARRGATVEEAQEILEDAIALIRRRNAELARRVSSDSDADSAASENWEPTPADPQRVIVIDEFPLVVEHRKLLALVLDIVRTGGKAAVTVALAAQGAGRDDFGIRTIRTMVTCKLLLACEPTDVQILFGASRLRQGWRADRLRAAQGDDPMDAGKVFCLDGDHQTPEPHRFYRLNVAGVRARAVNRHRATRPADTVGVAPLLVALLAAFDAENADRLPSAAAVDLIRAAHPQRWGSLTPEELADVLRPLGVSPRQLGRVGALANPRGYLRADAVRAAGGGS